MWSLHIIFCHNISLTDAAIWYYKMFLFNQIASKMHEILKIIFHMQLHIYVNNYIPEFWSDGTDAWEDRNSTLYC